MGPPRQRIHRGRLVFGLDWTGLDWTVGIVDMIKGGEGYCAVQYLRTGSILSNSCSTKK